MPRTRSLIINGTTSKKNTSNLPFNDFEEIVHGSRRGSLKALSDYDSDDSSEDAMDHSAHVLNYYDGQKSYCSSDSSSVITPRRLNKTLVVTSENSDSEDNFSRNLSSRKYGLRALSDYETGESNGKGPASSCKYQKLRRSKSEVSSGKDHVESESDSEAGAMHFNKGYKRKRSLPIETDSSDSERPIADIVKKQKTMRANEVNEEDESSSDSIPNHFTNSSQGPSTIHCRMVPTIQQSTPKSMKRKRKNRVSKWSYSSTEDSDSSDSHNTNWDGPKSRENSTFMRQWKKQRTNQSDDDSSSSKSSYKDSPENISNQQNTGSEDSSEDLPGDISNEGPSTRIHSVNITRPGRSVDNFPRRTTRSTSSANNQQLNFNNFSSHNSFENSPYESDNRGNRQRTISVNIQHPNNLNSRVTFTTNFTFPSQENSSVLANDFIQHSTRQLRPRRLQIHRSRNSLNRPNTSHHVPVESNDVSSDSDFDPRPQRQVVAIEPSSSSDYEDNPATNSRNYSNSTNESVEVEDIHNDSSDSDIRPTTLGNRQRRVLISDNSSSSDGEDVIAPCRRRRQTNLKLESDDDNGKPNLKSENNSSSDSDNESEKCPICFDKFRLQEVGSPESCDHSFCAVCIQEWAKNKNTCPVDRKVFNSITIRTHLQGEIDRHIPIETPTSNPFVDLVNVLSIFTTGAGIINTLELFNANSESDGPEEPFNSDSDGPDEICCVCRSDDDGDLISCDLCFNAFHLRCLNPRLYHIPANDWFCAECQGQDLRTVSDSSSSESD